MGIVDGLEPIKIDEEKAELGALAYLLFEHGVEVAGVEEASAIVGDGEFLDKSHGAVVLDGDCGVVAEDAKERDGVLRQEIKLAVEELDDA
jgi:ethanolamine utilization microcompartment shell protein EutS